MRICLVNPPLITKMRKNEEWSNYSLQNFQQLGLGYMASALENHGVEVDVIDCPCQRISNKEAITKILEENYDMVGVSLFHYNLINAKRIITKVRMQKKDIFIAAGGYVPTLNCSDTLFSNPDLNCCFIGEGEGPIIEFCQVFSQNGNWKDIEGIAYIEDGQVIIKKVPQAIQDLDSLAFPKRVRNKNYSQTLSILTSRGCYGNCSFCSEQSFNIINNSRIMRFRSPENVVNEIEELIKNYNPLYININDSNFLVATTQRKIWLRKFIRIMKDRDVKIKLRINTRANDILGNCELLKELINVGISSIFIGIESFNQRQLDLYNKKVTVKQNIESIELLKLFNVKIEIGFMIFEPFAKLCDIKENLNIIKELNLIKYLDYNQYFFSMSCKLYAIKGTKIYDDIQAVNMEKSNELGYGFIYADVHEYYTLLGNWCNIISMYNEYKYLIDKSILIDNGKWYGSMLDWFEEAMEFDLETMMELFLYVYKDAKEKEEYIKSRSNQFELLNQSYKEVFQKLS